MAKAIVKEEIITIPDVNYETVGKESNPKTESALAEQKANRSNQRPHQETLNKKYKERVAS